MGNFDDAINREREHAARQDQQASSDRAAAAATQEQAARLVREAAEKFSGLTTGLRLIVVRPRKLFDRGERIVGEDNDHRGTFTVVDQMRCWALPHSRYYARVVLTERGQLFTVEQIHRIHTRNDTHVVLNETDLRETNTAREFQPSDHRSSVAGAYLSHLNDVLAQAFVEYERAAERGRAGLARELTGRYDSW